MYLAHHELESDTTTTTTIIVVIIIVIVIAIIVISIIIRLDAHRSVHNGTHQTMEKQKVMTTLPQADLANCSAFVSQELASWFIGSQQMLQCDAALQQMLLGFKVWLGFTALISLQGCKWHKPEGCPGPRLRCPFCLVLPCLTILQKISNHLEMVKGNCTMQHMFYLCS